MLTGSITTVQNPAASKDRSKRPHYIDNYHLKGIFNGSPNFDMTESVVNGGAKNDRDRDLLGHKPGSLNRVLQ